MSRSDYMTYYKKIFDRARTENDYFDVKEKKSKFSSDFREFIVSIAAYINEDKGNRYYSIPYVEITKMINSFDKNVSNEIFDKVIQEINKMTKMVINQISIGEDIRKDKIHTLLGKILEHTNLAYYQKRMIIDLIKEDINVLNEAQEETRKILGRASGIQDGLLELHGTTLKTIKILLDLDEKHRKKNEDLEKKLKESQDRITTYEKKIKNSTMDMVGVIGIFSTIIFAVFGGLSQLAAIGGRLPDTPIYKIFIYSGITATIFLLVVFLSFYSLSKLTELNLKSFSYAADKSKFRFLKKYPVITVSLGIFFSFIIIGFVIFIIQYYFKI